MSDQVSSFRQYYDLPALVDRYAVDRERGVDVIIPVIHTNELWRANLLSIYREIPVNRLLIADGGCVDGSLDIVREFPRVEIHDHRAYHSLGFSLRKLIESVQTDWFIYLHSDIYLPEQWFDAIEKGREQYDWFESGQTTTILAKFTAPTLAEIRAYSGAQMGRKAAFARVLPQIDDDYLYRNEDIILASLVENAGFRYGKVADAFCEHQVMFKESPWERRVKRVYVEPEIGRAEEIRAAETYIKGIVKYLRPEQSAHLVDGIQQNVARLNELGVIDPAGFARWVAENNPAWSAIFPIPEPTPAGPSANDAEAGRAAPAASAAASGILAMQLARLRYLGGVWRAEGAAGAARLVARRISRLLR